MSYEFRQLADAVRGLVPSLAKLADAKAELLKSQRVEQDYRNQYRKYRD